jgi:hypothetical protein
LWPVRAKNPPTTEPTPPAPKIRIFILERGHARKNASERGLNF